LAGIQQADTIFHLVFFIALTSVLVQGPPIPWITRKLRLDRPANSGLNGS
jgi:potassium/hydrogen antiporter